MVGPDSVGAISGGGEQDPQPVVAEIAEPMGEAADLLDDQVDGLGAAVGDAVGVEVGQHLCPPGTEGAAEAGNLGDRAAVEGVNHLLRDRPAVFGTGVVGRSELSIIRCRLRSG